MRAAIIDQFPTRTLTVMPVATAMTLALVYLMLRLIATDFVAIDDTPRIKIASVILEQPEIEPPVAEAPTRPDPAETQPHVKIELPTTDFSDRVAVSDFGPVDFSGDSENTIEIGNSALVNLRGVRPQYPQRALSLGIEGYVDLKFDINAAGYTSNIQILDAQPSGYFENAASRAVSRWKYRVPEVNGEPRAVFGHSERIRFIINKD